MNTLDQWEADAKKKIDCVCGSYSDGSPMYFESKESERILALIDLVRKKDEALFEFFGGNHDESVWRKAREALALTDQLGREK